MNSIDRPKRRPAETRQQLLDVAAEAVVEKGLAGVTLDGVAKAAGVSKGGLLHHFPSKQHLIDALIVDHQQQFLDKVQQIASEDPCQPGRMIRAYLEVMTGKQEEQASKLCSIMAAEARDNPLMRKQWRDFVMSIVSEENAGGADPIALAIVQLASDGLWLAGLEGVFDDAPEFRTQIIQRLQQMTKQLK